MGVKRSVPLIGLTGGIGSGKSTVALRWVQLGAALVDTDAIARSLTAPGGAAMPAIAQQFGAAMVGKDGGLERAAMREAAFKDPGVKVKLEALLHPMIGEEAAKQGEVAKERGAPAIVFDVPLLAESTTWRQRVHRVLVIDCQAATQVARVSLRPGWTEAAARAVIAQQATREQRRSVADAVIHNDGIDLDTLHAQVDALWRAWAG